MKIRKVYWIIRKYARPSVIIAGSAVKMLRTRFGNSTQTIRISRPQMVPNLRATPVSLRMGDMRFWPQYWDAMMTRASPIVMVVCCTRKKIWLTVAAPDRAV